MEPVRAAAEALVRRLPGVEQVSVVLTAHGPAAKAPPARPAPQGEPPSLTIGRHPTPQQGGPRAWGGSSPSARARAAWANPPSRPTSPWRWRGRGLTCRASGRRHLRAVSQPRMMGVNQRPASPDGKTIIPLVAHGVTIMSIGLMLPEEDAVIWRGPMLMGALQQLLTQVAMGRSRRADRRHAAGHGRRAAHALPAQQVSGAIVVSTPQDVALLDARKALRAFQTLKTPILGLVENMSTFICPQMRPRGRTSSAKAGCERGRFHTGTPLPEDERSGAQASRHPPRWHAQSGTQRWDEGGGSGSGSSPAAVFIGGGQGSEAQPACCAQISRRIPPEGGQPRAGSRSRPFFAVWSRPRPGLA
jgi:hypothetical protein